jgi:hypothetical protein
MATKVFYRKCSQDTCNIISGILLSNLVQWFVHHHLSNYMDLAHLYPYNLEFHLLCHKI